MFLTRLRSLSHNEHLPVFLVKPRSMASGFIMSRSRRPQLDVTPKYCVNAFLLGPDPVDRLTLNRVFARVLRHTSSSGNRGWLHHFVGTARPSPPAPSSHRNLLGPFIHHIRHRRWFCVMVPAAGQGVPSRAERWGRSVSLDPAGRCPTSCCHRRDSTLARIFLIGPKTD